MHAIVADVGGTNTRLAEARGGRVEGASIAAFRNADFAGFEAVLAAFRAGRGGGPVEALAVAVAGPVSGARGRLTNRDWTFDATALSRGLDGARVELLNDLKAMGMALPHLPEAALEPLGDGPPRRAGNGQMLVVNLGTGFNVSPVMTTAAGTTCAEAEYGHTGLPAAVAALLGTAGEGFSSVESLFSGRGLARYLAAATGRPEQPAEVFHRVLAETGDAALHAAFDRYAEAIALLARDLALAFLPLSGMAFCGSVSRAVLAGDRAGAFAARVRQPFEVAGDLVHMPLSLIGDDTAALTGCARMLAGPGA